MEFISQALSDYSENHTSPESELLSELNRQTHLKVNQPRMLSGHLQGRFLSLISKIKQPQYVLEIGAYTGYSAICLAEGLSANGKLITIDPNEETNHFAQTFLERSAFKDKIELITGDATKVIPTLPYNWDIVFIDADKINYSKYFDLVIERVNRDGLLIADNVLWSGKVLDEKKDKETQAIHDFNEKVMHDKRIEKILLPLRDGLMMMRKV